MSPPSTNGHLTLDDIPEDLRKQVISQYFDEKRARKREERMKEGKRPRQPATSRYKNIASGQYRRKLRPHVDVSDREFVPGALKHWRQVHNLTQRQAQARIGYSPTSSTWRHYEAGFVAPPYKTLLAIIAATGLGYWVDQGGDAGLGGLRLDARRSSFQDSVRRRRAKRKVPSA